MPMCRIAPIMQPMSERDFQRSLTEIRLLRSRGEITPKEAYERHMAALSAFRPGWQAPAVVEEAEASPAGVHSRMWLGAVAIAMALVGGLLGILGAVVQEAQAGGVLVVFVGAPIIEEALKPAGIYILLTKWPQALRGQMHTASLTALSGLCFGLIESVVYVTLYYPEGGGNFVLFRFTVPVAMHVIASFLVGLGLSRGLIDWAAGRGRLPKATRNYYVVGALIHAVYNTSAVVLSLSGVIDF